jgi:endonuclease/exonuclease/phosphatase family metal-dependent hydrolase
MLAGALLTEPPATAQVAQLAEAIRRGSPGNAVIVAGDTNMRQRDRALLAQLLAEAELADACATLRCPEPSRVDRVLYRSSTELRLEPKAWRIDRSFVDARGEPLSDHLAVAVSFEWQERAGASVAALPVSP